ncbi:MAG TPA: hypothetical protein VIM74_02420, partial [Casimicrobiaceae bacterium]
SALGISIREFARRDGCNEKLVRRFIKDGRLGALADGTLDPALVATGWRLNNRRALDVVIGNNADSSAAANAARALAMVSSPGGAPYSRTEAERIAANYLARHRQLEFDIKSGAVIPTADAGRMVGEEYARVRTRLLAIAAEQAPRIFALKSAAEVQDALMACVVEALEELSFDRRVAAS